MIQHLVLDLETLDTISTSVILSLGCSLFAFEDDKYDFDYYVKTGLYIKFNPVEQLKLGRTASKDTVEWWKKQGTEAQQVLKPSANDILLHDGLLLLTKYLKQSQYDFKHSYCWCRGSSFDWPIVENAFRYCKLPLPYNGWKIRDIKTAIDIMAGVDNGAYTLRGGIPKQFIKHNSLHDSVLDILRLKELFKLLNED